MDNPLGRSLNTTTMHRLAQIILSGQVLIACALGAFGVIVYSPPKILVSTIVLVLISIVANAIFAKLYDVRSDYQSALITGLILALVLTPTLEPLRLATYVIIAMIAQASKYVVALRGRHLFNPAAFAIVIASLTGIGFASWWVASPVQSVVMIFAAFVMLYKLRLVRFGALFVLLSSLFIIGRTVMDGESVQSAAFIAFASWPILFVAGFMLSEPTTLPPRKWQKYLIAALVAILFALPFQIGSFTSSPAVALLIGNLIAFCFGQRRAITLKLKQINQLTSTSKEFVFTPAMPLRFAPGQYLELALPHRHADFKGSRRSFSLTSVPGSDEVSLGIRFNDQPSSFKQQLLSLATGDTITASNISGDFVLPKDATRKLVFIAGGIGVTPFISHIKSLVKNGESRDITLLYFVRSKEEAAYPQVVKHVKAYRFTGNKVLTRDMLVDIVPDVAHSTVYISGPPPMVDGAKRIARQAGAQSIKTDYFSGY